MVAKRRDRVDYLDDIPGKIPRVAGRKSYPPNPRNLPNRAQQLGKAPLPLRVAKAVHILPQKLKLRIPKVDDPPRFFKHRIRPAAPFLPAGIRHHAIGAELVAPLD